MNKAVFATILAGVLAGCSIKSPDAKNHATVTPVAEVVQASTSPRVRAENIRSVRYTGKWEFITHRTDGRFRGDSARSFHPGDAITIVFSGHRLRIYGIRGTNGGTGSVVIAGRRPVELSFYAPEKQTHVLMFDSGPLRGSIQAAGIVVASPRPPRLHGYVNVDEMQALAR